jgi:hypothetical protein
MNLHLDIFKLVSYGLLLKRSENTLNVSGVFSSMDLNSTFLRPVNILKSEARYLLYNLYSFLVLPLIANSSSK